MSLWPCMYSIEWQTRELPYFHIILWLEENITPESIDKVISDEISNTFRYPLLHDIVMSTMIHGPCGALNWSSPCMVQGECSKKYTRLLLKETQAGEDV